MSVYLAIDLGTTSCRTILFDETLQVLGDCHEEYALLTPQKKYAEQNAEDWWRLTLRTAKAAIKAAGIDPKTVSAISVSSQGITVVPVDEQYKPLCNALTWLDVRAKKQTARVEHDFGDEAFFPLTGKHIDPCYTLPKVLWLRENCPDIWAKTYKLLMPMEFLIGRLTGNYVTDHSMASGTQLYDLKSCRWSEEILSHYNIDPALLPEIKWSGECAGTVLPEVAKELGLSENCVVAVGAQDQKCASLGAGIGDGVMTISLGTAGAILKLWKEALPEEHRKVGWCGNVEEGTWVTEGVINTAGACLRWLRDIMFLGEDYQTIDREVIEARESGSSVTFYPYLNGPTSPDYYKDAKGCFYGLTLANKRGDLAAAVLEGVAYQIRIMLEAMNAYGTVDTLVLFGGGSKSKLWCQIIADITGLEILVPSTAEAAGAGAAMLAAKAAGEMLPALTYETKYTPMWDEAARERRYARYRSVEKKLWEEIKDERL